MAQEKALSKKMDPEFEALFKTLPPHPAFDGDIPTLREQVLAAKRKLTASQPDPEGVTKRDTTIPARDGQPIPVRIHAPENNPSGGPLVIFFHGGGFCIGSVENEMLICNLLVEKVGATVINADYRLAPEYKFPYAVNDAWDVTEWAATHPAEIPADLSKGFIVGGVSSGSNLAAVVSHLARDRSFRPALTGVLLLMPVLLDPTNLAPEHAALVKSYEECADAPVLPAGLLKQFIDNYAPDPSSHLWNLFAPPVRFGDLPPLYISVDGLDPLRDEGLLYERLLRKEHGCATRLDFYPGLPHSFYGNFPQLESSKKMLVDVVEGLKWLLKQRKG